jgi:putative sterol carrier protein
MNTSGVAGDPTSAFFDELERRGHEPLLAGTSGTVRLDVGHGKSTEHWYLEISDGDVAVSRLDASADAVMGADRDLFNEIVQGRANTMAAMLRGAMTIEGDVELMLRLQRIFPGPDYSGGKS